LIVVVLIFQFDAAAAMFTHFNRKHLGKNPALKGRLGANGTSGTSGSIEETDPVWLKGKGDDMYRSGDYRSAINAYTAGTLLLYSFASDTVCDCRLYCVVLL
jgi:hypothetical protein